MNNFELVRDLFNDMYVFLNGKKPMGLNMLLAEYPDVPLLSAFLGKLDEAVKVPFNDVMQDCFAFYKKYVGGPDTADYWEQVVADIQKYNEKWNSNEWCRGLILSLLELLEKEKTSRRPDENPTDHEVVESMDEELEEPIAA